MAEVTSTPIAVAYRDEGFLNAGISASATTVTVAAIYKYPSGVKTKQGLNSTSGYAEISLGGITEVISFGAASVDGTTKVTTLTDVRRGLSQTGTSASFAAGTGRTWAKGARIRVIDFSNYLHNTAFKDKANTFEQAQTFSAPVVVSGTSSYVKLPELTTTQRDALTPSEGMLIKNSTTGTNQQYVGGSWVDIGDAGTNDASTTVAGKVEEATLAEVSAGTAAGGTGARLFLNPSLTKKDSTGAAEGNVVALNGSAKVDPSLLGTGTRNGTKYLRDDGSYQNFTQDVDAKLSTVATSASVGTSTTAEAVVNSYTIGANTTAVGDTFRVTAAGRIRVDGASGTVRLRIGGVSGNTLASAVAHDQASNSAYFFQGYMVVRSITASGTVTGGFLYVMDGATGTDKQAQADFHATTVAFDSTASNDLVLTFDSDSSQPATIMNTTVWLVEKITPDATS